VQNVERESEETIKDETRGDIREKNQKKNENKRAEKGPERFNHDYAKTSGSKTTGRRRLENF
jgi:hypothetical protein